MQLYCAVVLKVKRSKSCQWDGLIQGYIALCQIGVDHSKCTILVAKGFLKLAVTSIACMVTN